MSIRTKISAALALVAGLWLGGCGGGERTPFAVETDDGGFRQGQQLVRQGRDAEALTTFLKVIERRGEQSSAESHLEAGLIYLRHIKDPIEAIHHFRKYLELQPNAKQAVQVRGLIDTARREYARTLPGRPLESQVTGINLADRVKDLERENDDLKSEIAGLRALAPAPSLRVSRTTIDFAEPTSAAPAAASPPPAQIHLDMAEPPREPVVSTPPVSRPSLITPAPSPKSAPAKSAAGKATAGKSSAGRKHTVSPGDTLYNIAKKYGVKMEEIVAANRDQLPSVASPLRRGAELRIP